MSPVQVRFANDLLYDVLHTSTTLFANTVVDRWGYPDGDKGDGLAAYHELADLSSPRTVAVILRIIKELFEYKMPSVSSSDPKAAMTKIYSWMSALRSAQATVDDIVLALVIHSFPPDLNDYTEMLAASRDQHLSFNDLQSYLSRKWNLQRTKDNYRKKSPHKTMVIANRSKSSRPSGCQNRCMVDVILLVEH